MDECLRGSIRLELDTAERGIWYDLLLFAGACRKPGQISANPVMPYPHDFIAGTLKIPLEFFEATLIKLEEQGRIHENETGIHIVNWDKYQSEYQRQKPYRDLEEKPTKQLPLPVDEKLASLIKLYEENIGIITPISAEQLKDIADKYSPDWFKDAVAEAVKANVRKLSYIESILERWSVEGKGTPKGIKKKGELPKHYLTPDEEDARYAREHGISDS